MNLFLRDVRFAVRSWRRHPAALAAAAGALSLATAAVTAVFSIVSGVLLQPLPYPDPERLVMVWQDMRARGGPERDWISPGLFVEWQRRATLFEHLAAVRGWQPNLTAGDEPERLRGAAVSHGYFAALGVAPALGRTFATEDDHPGAAPIAVISHGLWARRFGVDPQVLDRSILLDGQATRVIGVMPPSFRPAIVEAEIWTPLRVNPAAAPRGMVVLRVLGRIRADATLDQARAEMAGVANQLSTEDPEWERARTPLVPLHEDVVGNVRPMLLILGLAVGFVMLIAAANLAQLLLARATERAREMTVRAALGASRLHILRQILTESLLLAAAAGTVGAMAGWWGLRGLLTLAPPSAPRLQDVHVDLTVLLVTAVVTITAALGASLAPAAAAMRLELAPSLRDGGRESTGSSRLRSILVVAEVALALVLVVGAALLTRTLLAMQRVDLGFAPSGLLSASVHPPRGAYQGPEPVRQLFNSVLERAGAIPGVQAAALTSVLPMSGAEVRINFAIPGRPRSARPEDEPLAAVRQVSAGYFKTMGIRLATGRELGPGDTADSPAVVIVNEALSRRYWPGDNAVGRRVDVEMQQATIVGVVADVHHAGPAAAPLPEMYLPYTQFNTRSASIVLRTAGDPAALAPALRRVVRQIDPNLPLAAVAPMSELVDRSVAQSRFVAVLLSGFAILATALTLFGIYSVQSFSVSRRTREIGVRMALGAERRAVVGMVLRESLVRVAAGLAAGVLLALGGARLIQALLFGVTATDPLTYIVMAALIAVSALAASYIPAQRAARIDPLVALRED